MICPKCHKETPNEYKYCVSCGQEIHVSDPETQYKSENCTQPINYFDPAQCNLPTDQIVATQYKRKKGKLKIIITIIVLILIAIIAFAIFAVNFLFSQQYIYRETNWGMSKEQVIALEESKNNTPTINTDNFLHYSISNDEMFDQEPLYLAYTFKGENDSLSSILVTTSDKTFNTNQFSDLYKKLEKKFGEPHSKYGETVLYAWELETTEITLFYTDSTDDDSEYVCLLFSDKNVNDDDNESEID